MTGESSSHTIRVRILGREVPVRTSLPEEQVRRVEQYVTERIERFSSGIGTADTLLVATLTLMHFAEECLALKDENSVLRQDTTERLGRIIQQLDLDW